MRFLDQLSFRWRGRDSSGVSRWSGSARTLTWLSRIFCAYGSIAGAGGLAALLALVLIPPHGGPMIGLMAVGLTHGVIFVGIGIWAELMRRHIARLSSADELSARLGVDEGSVRAMAEQRNIAPRLILNAQPYYDLADFRDAEILLRASGPVAAHQENLLRPAAGAAEVAQGELLRAAEPEESPRPVSRYAEDEAPPEEVQLRGGPWPD